ncbi:MAG: LPS-assembly protein LptD, partial [Muribaculaceae bacterium]|nr:LPS-assembly protein LptD [Muribaculaceae bacterium]
YMENGKYTTCDDHEHPHFYMQLTKAKVTPRKNVVSGPAYMVLCDVPLPLALPFGYFPFSSKYSSGVIMPTFGDDYQKGFYLSDGGYYFAINDYVDLALTGEIYTKGSWGLAAQSSYRKRYKYSGNFNISYLNTVTGDKGDPDYTKQKNFRLTWSHSQDAKANPKMTLSASVNFATSGYSRNDINSYYNQSFTENTKNSTVNMSYRFSSKFQMSTTASITQRTQDSTLAVSFPNITLSLSQVAPFKRKRAVGAERWYEKIKMSYTGTFQNSLTSKQNEFFKKSLIKDWSNGMRHSVPVSATFTMFKYFNVSPSISMNDRMYSNKVRRSWDPNASAEVLDTIYGFYNVFDFNASLTFDTKIYGFYTPLKFLGDKIKMIRSVMSPSVSFSASPDFSKPFWGYYGSYNYQDAAGNLINKKYNHFSNGIFGSVGEGKSGMVSVSLSNNLEMKVKSDKDSTGMKKISLIENFTISQSYNFAADSMRWSNINTSLALRLVKNFNLNLSATWDPYTYQLSPSGTPVRVDRTRLQALKKNFLNTRQN